MIDAINKLFDELKKLINDRGIEILENVDFKPIERILKKLKPKRGRPPVYSYMSKFKAVIYGMASGVYNACAIARKVTSEVAKRICELEGNISHDRINEFLKELSAVIEEVLHEIVKQVMKLGITDGKKQVMDGTSIETKFMTDEDAKWSYEDSYEDIREEYYFGYGLLINFCSETHLPLAAEFTQSKKVSYKEVKKAVDKTPIIPKTFLGDPEFDMIKLHKLQISRGARIVVPYNPRKAKEPKRIKYRIQQWFPELTNKELDEEHKERVEAEHAISTLKEHFGLEKFSVKGWNRVKVHTFLCMILRLMHAIAVHKTNPFASVRKTITVL